MANSSEVDHNTPILVSQYNDLRDDVLNNSTGHNHSGSADGGKQLAGSVALSSYSVRPGQLWYGALSLVKRQGGNSTEWKTAGTSNYDLSTEIGIQVGILNITVAAGYYTNVGTISFGTAFGTPPLVFANVDTTLGAAGTIGLPSAIANTESGTHALVLASRAPLDGTASPETIRVLWMAIGSMS